MPNIPTTNKTKQQANYYALRRLIIDRSPNGFKESQLDLICDFGFQKEETDPLTGYKNMDVIETKQMLSIQLGELRTKLQMAVDASMITQEAMNTHLMELLALDAQITTQAERSLELYQAAQIVKFPDEVSRFV